MWERGTTSRSHKRTRRKGCRREVRVWAGRPIARVLSVRGRPAARLASRRVGDGGGVG
uniref:Uncharacterized protein n=1 Tax=Arundo donax TaxID=35708 RepID=A0A0A8Z7X8_ARUDO